MPSPYRKNFLAALLSDSKEPAEEHYYEALGRFVTRYARAEAAVHVLVRKLSQINENRARVVFSGMRLTVLTDRARQLFRLDMENAKGGIGLAKPKTESDYNFMDTTLSQLDAVSKVRGELVHRTVDFIENSFVVTNALTAKAFANIETRTVSHGDLKAMASDCVLIFLRLHWVADRRLFLDGTEISEKEAMPALNLPWRYKPPEPSPQKKQRRKGRQSQKRQPASSEGK